jgi:hypothetical protein
MSNPPEKPSSVDQDESPDLADAVKRRAYEISQSDAAGTADENWQQAERELRGVPTPPLADQ